ncbi:hypothetical protein HYX19_01910 [Candidatus Woesearchaeota archaeon]|nr:hypothetical protein [Candidatus Woesearchaeota archaeon]
MGKWAKDLFGKESFDSVGIVIAGTNSPKFERKILRLFDKVISSKDSVYHAHLVRKNNKEYPIVFNVYGAPAMVDVMTEMHDGGCHNLIFIGYAYGGFKNLDVGSIIVSDKSYHFEGIYHHIETDRKIDYPDKELKRKLEEIFKKNKINFYNGTNVSVPAVSFQPRHANREYQKIKPLTLEMELAACFSRAKDIGIRSVGILIISDNKSTSIGDKSTLRNLAKIKVIETIIKKIHYFNLSKLKTRKKFDIDEHLASIIEDPNEMTNVYRKK